MDFLSLFVIVPFLTVVGIVFCKDFKQVRLTAAIGMTIQLGLAVALIFMYLAERKAGNMAEMLFMADYVWFPSLNIRYAIGVDGISVAMIGLTAVVVITGILASWEVQHLSREFFISLILHAERYRRRNGILYIYILLFCGRQIEVYVLLD